MKSIATTTESNERSEDAVDSDSSLGYRYNAISRRSVLNASQALAAEGERVVSAVVAAAPAMTV